jgi:hypothetical protein
MTAPSPLGAAASRLVDRIDPDLLGDVDSRCLAFDRLLGQLNDCLGAALVLAAANPDRELRNQIVAARLAVDELQLEAGDLGLSLLALRDAINAETPA